MLTIVHRFLTDNRDDARTKIDLIVYASGN